LAPPSQDDKTRDRFEQLAKDLKYFPTGEFVYGRSDKLSRLLPERWKESWYVVLKEINSTKHTVADLQALLKHKDPNVRLLALAALFQREDAKLLPDFAAMTNDEMKTVPDLFIVRESCERGAEADVTMTPPLEANDVHAQDKQYSIPCPGR
jgi:HEAT repeat protein